ncbi:hypothetical protein Rsub_06908 [Raphidocelis subcapitata]|uniref:Uncharacterized protein n=1 Tax=Raphidocelis subcapitata TaxID=307507 RepID=A0A2V0P351_9CHLO|nr:hypothetical protein Rsub_06908 [Raphidocelis subcapitata]|eukprot:GBF94286.1 hypothetical protein Rsub_06908 [Raphidocelis subcapitata]
MPMQCTGIVGGVVQQGGAFDTDLFYWKGSGIVGQSCDASCAICTPTSDYTSNSASNLEVHRDKGVPLHVAAFIKALHEVTRAELHRGFD